jgi:hypothetical protein
MTERWTYQMLASGYRLFFDGLDAGGTILGPCPDDLRDSELSRLEEQAKTLCDHNNQNGVVRLKST